MMSSCFLTVRRSSQCILVYDVKKGPFQIRSNTGADSERICEFSKFQCEKLSADGENF